MGLRNCFQFILMENGQNLVEKNGILHCYTKGFRPWKKRWLILQDNLLTIYSDSRHEHLENIIDLKSLSISITSKNEPISSKGYAFKIYDPEEPLVKPLYLAADCKSAMTQWINALRLSSSIVNDILISTASPEVPTADDNKRDVILHKNHLIIDSLQQRSYRPQHRQILRSMDENTDYDHQSAFQRPFQHQSRPKSAGTYQSNWTTNNNSDTNSFGFYPQHVENDSLFLSSVNSYDPLRRTQSSQLLDDRNTNITTSRSKTNKTSNNNVLIDDDISGDDEQQLLRFQRYNDNNSYTRQSLSKRQNRKTTESNYQGGGDNDMNLFNNERLVDSFGRNNSHHRRFRLRTPTIKNKNKNNNRVNVDEMSDDNYGFGFRPNSNNNNNESKVVEEDREARWPSSDFAVVDRLVLGPAASVLDTRQQKSRVIDNSAFDYMNTRSRQSSTRSILRGRSKSIGDFSQKANFNDVTYNLNNSGYVRTRTENELLAWQNRMLQREQRGPSRPPLPNGYQVTGPKANLNSSYSSSRYNDRLMPSNRPVSATSSLSVGSQRFDYNHHDTLSRSARVVKRHIELLYHLQSFYERIVEQLYNGSGRNSLANKTSHSVYFTHCRKVSDQLDRLKPNWERKINDLQRLLKEIPMLNNTDEWPTIKSENSRTPSFLQRRSMLKTLYHSLVSRGSLDDTHLSVLNDIDHVLNEDNICLQLEDELTSLLQHQSLLNEYCSLLQWNYQIYSINEQNRVENLLPILRDQSISADGYVAHVSQQLTELVSSLRSLEKYILSYVNTIPQFNIDDEYHHYHSSPRSYTETDLDTLQARNLPNMTSKDANAIRFSKQDRWSPFKNQNNNNNNKKDNRSRIATVKPARRLDNNNKCVGILKSTQQQRYNVKQDFDSDTIDKEIFKPDKVDIPERLVDFENEERLTTAEKLARLKKKEELRKMLSKQSVQEMSDNEFSDTHGTQSFLHKRHEEVKNREK
ncbi:unnamed protein product, partial [Didymodactylos carnosus]